MRIGSAIAAVILITGAAYADPRKVDPQDAPAHKPNAPVVLASADTPRPTPNDVAHPTPAPAKHPNGRMTHCRCGDPQPDSQKPDR